MCTCFGHHAQALHTLSDPLSSFWHKKKAASLPDHSPAAAAAAAEDEYLHMNEHPGIALPAAVAAAQCWRVHQSASQIAVAAQKDI